mgnify:CR=1 FL=1
MHNFIKRYFSPFIGTDTGKIKPMFFWASLFLTLTAISIISIILYGRTELTGLVGIMSGLVIALITVYNQGNGKKIVNDSAVLQRYKKDDVEKFDVGQEGPR